MTLSFRRNKTNGTYFAKGAFHEYAIYRILDGTGAHWVLILRELIETAGVRHAVGQPIIHTSFEDTLTLAKAVARSFEALGDDYKPVEHGARNRFTQATLDAYGPIVAALRAGV